LFIELTDHLRCPADHEERFLVLLPDRMEDRYVKSGQLGCPICSRTFRLVDGVLDTGDAPAPDPASSSSLNADALTALIGLSGPGGYIVLVGVLAGLWQELSAANPGVALVAVNPGADVLDGSGVSVIRSGRIPLKSRSMRAAVLSRPYAAQMEWVKEASRVVLPGLRIVGEGGTPPTDLIELMASAPEVWVGTTKRQSP
jgi:uncharacterized protein YbaR (Trm112 family)